MKLDQSIRDAIVKDFLGWDQRYICYFYEITICLNFPFFFWLGKSHDLLAYGVCSSLSYLFYKYSLAMYLTKDFLVLETYICTFICYSQS